MTNPYETLGVREGATPEEIKAAYRELVKKYHPDRYGDNPLKDLADEKMREINEAYDYFERNNYGQSDFKSKNDFNSYGNGGYGSGGYGASEFQRLRDLINSGNIRAAEQELDKTSSRNAEWFFLRGVISIHKGWYNQGYKDVQTAINMDPNNHEYREFLGSLNNNNNAYMNNRYSRGAVGNRDCCNDLACFCCADQMCECCGGDLCDCC